MKRFALDILRVLKSQASKQISVLDLAIVYSKYYKEQNYHIMKYLNLLKSKTISCITYWNIWIY